MEPKIVLKDGTEILNGSASRTGTDLMVTIPGSDIVQATLTFSNPEKTAEIICYFSVYKTSFENFTNLYSVQYFADRDCVEVWLKGEAEKAKETMLGYTVPEEYLPESMRTRKQEETDHE